MWSRIALAASLVLTSPAAVACTVGSGYQVPNVQQLTAKADLIVVARVEGDLDTQAENIWDAKVALHPLALIKGRGLPTQLDLDGMTTDHPLAKSERVNVRRSDPDELAAPNPDALTGACNRYLFTRGMTLVLFYTAKAGGWEFMGYPFARVSEDVPDVNSRWVQAVRAHAAIAHLPLDKRRQAMVAQAATWAKGNADQRAIAADMRRLLALPGALDPIK